MIPAFTLLDVDASGEVSCDEFVCLWRFQPASLEELNDLRSFLRDKVGLPDAFEAILAKSGEEVVFRHANTRIEAVAETDASKEADEEGKKEEEDDEEREDEDSDEEEDDETEGEEEQEEEREDKEAEKTENAVKEVVEHVAGLTLRGFRKGLANMGFE